MKKAPLLTVAVILGAFFIAPVSVFAYGPVITPWTNGTYAYAHGFAEGPDFTGDFFHLGGGDSPFNLSVFGCSSAGLYMVYFYQGNDVSVYTSSSESVVAAAALNVTQYYCFNHVFSNSPPDLSTHIVSFSPALFATTTSPVSVSFVYYNSSSTPSNANGYSIYFVNTLSRASKTVYGYLSDLTYPALHTQATTTVLSSGTWSANVNLYHWTGLPSVVGYYNTFVGQDGVVATNGGYYFGVDFNDNVTVTDLFPAIGSYASTSCNVNFIQFSFGDCMGYLFIPSSDMFSMYGQLPVLLETKFPFSYLYSMQSIWSSLVASTTNNSLTLTMNLHDFGIGSTSPMGNILPNVTVFSASTTKEYFPSGVFDLLKGLASIALILTLFSDIFFTTRDIIRV